MRAAQRGEAAPNDKLAAAAHLLIARLPSDELGATKLNKILWFADCEFYRRHGRSLTGETEYVRQEFGPCPVGIGRVLASLKAQGAIVETPRSIAGYVQRGFISLIEPAVETFHAEEIDILLGVALELCPLSAKAASELSHDDLWQATEPGGRMSVQAGSVRVSPPTPEVLEWAQAAFHA
jgi:hypothetical protein